VRVAVLIVLALLAGCAPRATLSPAPEAALDLPTRAVFVSTLRSAEGAGFGAGRAPAPAYLRLDLTRPPERSPGAVRGSGRAPDPATDFLVADTARFADATAFRRDLRAALATAPTRREAIVYVHGFNNSFDESVLRLAQIADDFRMGGVAVNYAWPSAAHPLAYVYDRDSLMIARDGLDELISELRAAGADSIILVAHSVGSMLVMETLRQRAIARPGSVARDIAGVILISPDLDVDLFRAQATRIGSLPEPFGIFVSRRDRVLALSARLTGARQRLGNLSGASAVADLDVTVLDVTDFSSGAGHFTAASSPALIRLFERAGDFDAAFRGDSAGRAGLFPGAVLTVQNATEIVLSPLAAASN
jgi:esterase/lipase superfamily enzyme